MKKFREIVRLDTLMAVGFSAVFVFLLTGCNEAYEGYLARQEAKLSADSLALEASLQNCRNMPSAFERNACLKVVYATEVCEKTEVYVDVFTSGGHDGRNMCYAEIAKGIMVSDTVAVDVPKGRALP